MKGDSRDSSTSISSISSISSSSGIPTMSSSRPDTAATNRDMDSEENIWEFVKAGEATTYDNLLLDGRISNADVRSGYGKSGLHIIPALIGWGNKDVTDMLLSYLLTCDPPADVNGTDRWGCTPMWCAAYNYNTYAVKALIDFGGDRTIKSSNSINHLGKNAPNSTPLDIAKKEKSQETIELFTECFPSEE